MSKGFTQEEKEDGREVKVHINNVPQRISFPGKQSPFLQLPNHISTGTVGDFKAMPVLPGGGPQKPGQTTVTFTTFIVHFEGFYDCVQLGKVLFGMDMFSKYWACRETAFREATAL